MGWEPPAQETEEKLIELAYTWGDIEEKLSEVADDIPLDPETVELQLVPPLVERAFRVEVITTENEHHNPITPYVLLYDVADPKAREAARGLDVNAPRRGALENLINVFAPYNELVVKVVSRSTAVEGQICRRGGEPHPPRLEPTLDQLPPEPPRQAQVGFVQRDVYWLTPIEAKFYDAARETALFFAVQPWIQGTDRRYRPDFLFFFDGRPHAVELDGHEYHKTKEQRSADAKRERWLEERGIRVHRFTGSQVHADAQGCVTELLNLLRSTAARP